LKTNLAKHW